MPRLTNNSLAGLSLNSDIPLPVSTAITTVPSSVVGGTGTFNESLSTATVVSSSMLPVMVTKASGRRRYILRLCSTFLLSIWRLVTTSWSATLPNPVPLVCSPQASLNPLHYVPPHPWPLASFSQHPEILPHSLQPTVSGFSSSPMLLRPPFCVYNPVLGRASQFVNSIPQPAFSQLPGLGQPPSSQYGQGNVPVAAFHPTLVMPPSGLADAAGMFASVPRLLEAFVVGPG